MNTQVSKRRSKRKTVRRINVLINLFTFMLLLSGLYALTKPAKILPTTESISFNAEEYPPQLLELLERNPETADFVSGYANYKADIDKSIKQSEINGAVPHFLQWDKRWGYDLYGNEMIALTGCGPTCISMVAVGLTKNLSYTPLYVAKYGEAAGYIDENAGTTWEFLSSGSEAFGLVAAEVSLDYNAVVNKLNNKQPIIASVRPGDFTTTGHFIVIYGVNENGELLINDPNSKIRSEKAWDWEVISPQIRNMWAYTV